MLPREVRQGGRNIELRPGAGGEKGPPAGRARRCDDDQGAHRSRPHPTLHRISEEYAFCGEVSIEIWGLVESGGDRALSALLESETISQRDVLAAGVRFGDEGEGGGGRCDGDGPRFTG